jgi:hypothetical protein
MGLRAAINAKCKGCVYDPSAPGNWRQQVTCCAVKTCPLWEYRPQTSTTLPDKVRSYYGVELGP